MAIIYALSAGVVLNAVAQITATIVGIVTKFANVMMIDRLWRLEKMIISLPIEDVKELMYSGVICEVHCNGIDLCKVPIQHDDSDEVDYDFVLFGHQRYSGSAKVGDMATAHLTDLEIQMEKLQANMKIQQQAISKYAGA